MLVFITSSLSLSLSLSSTDPYLKTCMSQLSSLCQPVRRWSCKIITETICHPMRYLLDRVIKQLSSIVLYNVSLNCRRVSKEHECASSKYSIIYLMLYHSYILYLLHNTPTSFAVSHVRNLLRYLHVVYWYDLLLSSR